MVDEAAAALVPGPVATTALATLLVEQSDVLELLITGERIAGVALSADVEFDGDRASGTADYVLGRRSGGGSAAARRRFRRAGRRGGRRRHGRTVEGDRLLAAAGACRAGLCARAEAVRVDATFHRRGGHRAGCRSRQDWRAGRCRPLPSTRRFASSSASRSAVSRRSSTCAPRCCCVPSRLRWPRLTPRRAVARDRRATAVHRRGGGRDRGHRRREGQREGLHPGARRHRHHLGARRASVSAARVRHRAVPGRRA